MRDSRSACFGISKLANVFVGFSVFVVGFMSALNGLKREFDRVLPSGKSLVFVPISDCEDCEYSMSVSFSLGGSVSSISGHP